MGRDIRRLLSHASATFDTIRLEGVTECGAGLSHGFERLQPVLPTGNVVTFESHSDPVGSKRGATYDWRAYWRKPCHWRDEIIWVGGATAISISCGATSLAYVSFLRTLYTNRRPEGLLARLRSVLGPQPAYRLPTVETQLELLPLIDPSFFATGWELTVLDERTHVGRKTLRVEAVRVARDSRPALWQWIDHYEILVDEERGVLLRYAGIVDGEEAGIFSVRSVNFDEPIPDAIFSYEPPEGTSIVWV